MAANTSVRSLELKNLSPVHSDSPSEDSPVPEMLEERNNTLQTLRFRYCDIGPYVASIAKGLVHNTTLKELVLDSCGVTDTGAKSLADMLVNNTTLETLDISNSEMFTLNRMSSEGVGHLAEALKGNSTLRVLRLEDVVHMNPEPLAVALTVNTTLEILKVRYFYEVNPEKLMSYGVLQQLLMIAIERTVSEFGGEETGCALMTIM